MYLISLILTVMLVGAQASAPSDLSGTWKMVPDRSGSPAQTPPVTEMVFVIEQGSDHVKLDMAEPGTSVISVTYPIVAAPKLPDEALGAGQQRAYWDGDHLVVERGGTINGQTVSSKQTLTLSPDRSEMTVERLVIVQHGYTLKGTPNYATVKDVFVRAR